MLHILLLCYKGFSIITEIIEIEILYRQDMKFYLIKQKITT
jgi:hypothetical protein